MSDVAIKARAKQDQIESNKEYVRETIDKNDRESNVLYVTSQHVMELLLHVWRVKVSIIAKAVTHIVVVITIIKIAPQNR